MEKLVTSCQQQQTMSIEKYK